MINCRLVFALLSGLITSAGAAQDVERPDVFCITYLSTYLVAVSAPTDVENSASGISDTALAEISSTGSTSDLIPNLTTVTKDDNEATTELPTSSVTINPTQPGTNSRPVIFRIIPDTRDTRRGLRRRDLGGFVGSTQEVCTEASLFNLSNGRLLQGTAPVFYAGESFKELDGQSGSLPQNAITTTFAEVGGFLQFRNSALPNGEAGFCQTPQDGRTYITFTSSPSGCLAVRLSIVEAEDCEDGVTSASTTLTNDASQSLPDVATSSADLSQTRSPDFTQQLPTGVTQPPEVTSKINFPTLDPSSDGFINTRTKSFHFSNTSISIELSTAQSEPSVGPSLPVKLSSTDFFPSLPVTSETVQQSIDSSTTIDSFPTVSQSSLSPLTSEETSKASVPEITTSLFSTPLETSLEASVVLSDSTTVLEPGIPSTTVPDSTSSFSVESTPFDVSTEPSTVETTTTTAAPTRACSNYFIFQPTTLFAGDQAWENEVKSIDLPFPVGIYTDSSDKINVGVNGLITFFGDDATADENEELPSDSISSVAVCPFWDDLRIEPNAGHDITYEIVDDPDFRAVSVEWCGLDSNDVLTHFVVRFQEYTLSNPVGIFMRYFTSNGGRSATIGVQDGNVNKFLQYSFNQENAVPDGSTVLVFTLGGDERTVYIGP